jgi:hypothetical protein
VFLFLEKGVKMTTFINILPITAGISVGGVIGIIFGVIGVLILLIVALIFPGDKKEIDLPNGDFNVVFLFAILADIHAVIIFIVGIIGASTKRHQLSVDFYVIDTVAGDM